MSGLTGIKQIFFGGLTTNCNNAPKKEFNNYTFLNHPIHDTISFQKSHRHYTEAQKSIMHTLKKLAVKLKLPDFYTGKPFGKGYNPTIEHVIPHSQKEKAAQKGLSSVNNLENFVLTGSRINGKRDSMSLKEWYKKNPEFLENSKKALKEYEKINLKEGQLFEGSSEINGKSWVEKLKKLLNGELGYIAFTGRKNQTLGSYQKLSYVA